jgi:hypothetical protein
MKDLIEDDDDNYDVNEEDNQGKVSKCSIPSPIILKNF